MKISLYRFSYIQPRRLNLWFKWKTNENKMKSVQVSPFCCKCHKNLRERKRKISENSWLAICDVVRYVSKLISVWIFTIITLTIDAWHEPSSSIRETQSQLLQNEKCSIAIEGLPFIHRTRKLLFIETQHTIQHNSLVGNVYYYSKHRVYWIVLVE